MKPTFFSSNWTLAEKNRLVEGIKRYGPDNYLSIAEYIDSKSAEQVEEKIKKVRSMYIKNSHQEKVSDSNREPVEVWMDLIQEMVTYDEDFSSKLSEIFGLITKYEKKTTDESIPHLQWKNIYEFLSDMLENRIYVKTLTDVESLVVLDLMNNIYDTLQHSDVSEQSRALKTKFDLLNYKSGQTSNYFVERKIISWFISLALSNDFKEIERVFHGEDMFDIQHDETTLVKPKYLSLNPLCLSEDIIELKQLGPIPNQKNV
ncbi:hypothetical protein Btru_064491 [Bulinus truncatus]|nr:hypothetical protein Btru_064491 [Bulinus truncatus]